MISPADTAGHDAAAGRRTSALVRVQDKLASVVITSGGLVVLLAMLGICVFLVVSVGPLFAGGRVTGEVSRFDFTDGPPGWVSLDPAFGRMVTLGHDGRFRVRSLDDGRVLAEAPALEDGTTPAAIRFEAGEGWLTLTTADGSFAIVRTALSWKPIDDAPARATQAQGRDATADGLSPGDEPDTYIQRLDDGSIRRWTLEVTRLGPFDLGPRAVSADSRGKTARERQFAALGPDGPVIGVLRGRRALGADTIRYRASHDQEVPTLNGPAPDWVFASGSGSWVYAIWRPGEIALIDRRKDRNQTDLPPVVRVETAAPISAVAMGLGSETLLVGDTEGGVSTWTAHDGTPRLTRRRVFGSAAVTAIRAGDRDRTVTAGFADGSAVMYNTLSNKVIVRLNANGLGPIASIAASPDSSVVLAVDDAGHAVATGVEPGHTEASFSALFSKVQYEGYDKPEYVYQSTGSADAEPKFSLIPLIFGTIKATVVSMLFAAPIAVLAAIYSSEFLHRRARRFAKPTIELMASLPSVVLGFMAAMVIAPFVRDQLPRVIVFAATGPLVVVLAAHAWRLIPRDRRARWGTVGQFGLIAVALALGVVAAIPAGGLIQNLLFSPPDGGPGSIQSWLNGDFGSGTAGWLVALLFPIVCVLLILDSTVFSPFWRRVSGMGPGWWANVCELIRLLLNLSLGLLIAWTLGAALDAAGFDPRDSIFGHFSQRNTLVVGMIMGVAVIPIIYTISEDAIRGVPDALRSASLGVGATPWQTAIRVVLPVAGSGIFSAIMIGLGRAVGETMIVLMATGNTPEMSMNIFSGFRTLAANIAVELPEAPRASTHYHVLFLCGLVLFAMTLAINTTAEVVRQHFRKRNAAL
ncbi:MAG: ABC transporter permease subunit [Phycisphaeraceae bacterium]|nr:MAG: ABC transporter permease subunit [Phycisphaeraceae bacterium]